MLESKFKTNILIPALRKRFPGCVITHVTDIQGGPDLLVLYKNKWAALEGKKSSHSAKQPNQDYWNETLNKMSFSRIIHQSNMEEVLNELQRSFEL